MPYIAKQHRCENCGKYKIERKDYRPDEQGNTNKVFVCRYCFQLNSEWFYRVRAEGHNPKKVLEA